MLYAIENLVKKREGTGYALEIRHLVIRKGDRLALTGESGCGKSTTLDILGLVLAPDSCERFSFSPLNEEIPVWRLYQERKFELLSLLRLRYLGYVLQTGELFPFLSVEENMLFCAELAGQNKDESVELAHALAKMLSIERKMRAMPATLSVGERQRVAIVRALVAKPAVILADEPTAALDPLNAGRVMEAFLEALYAQNATFVLVTHNTAFVRDCGLRELRFFLQERDGGLSAVLDDTAC